MFKTSIEKHKEGLVINHAGLSYLISENEPKDTSRLWIEAKPEEIIKKDIIEQLEESSHDKIIFDQMNSSRGF